VNNVRETAKWANKKDILIKREEKKKKGKREARSTRNSSSNSG
jgi:hypothetical protein